MKPLLKIIFIPFIVWNLTINPIIGLVLMSVMIFFWKRVYRGIAVGAAAYIIMLPLLFNSITEMSKKYTDIINKDGDLNIVQTWNIYGLHLAAIGTAAPIFPEVSKEAFLMHIPKKKNDTIEFKSDFFLKSKKFRQAIKKSSTGIVRWKYADYNILSNEARVALALCPAKYRTIKNGYEASILVGYNPKVHATFIDTKYVKLSINEALFYYLEKKGLLFRYVAIWRSV